MTFKGFFMSVLQIALIGVLPWAVMNGSWLWWSLAVVMFVVYAGIGTTVTYHRLLAHRVFQSSLTYRYVSTFFAAMGSLLSPMEWVQQHTAHHRYVDTDKDPHSPVIMGWKAMFFFFHLRSKGTLFVMRLGKEKFMRILHVWYYPILGAYLLALYLIGGVHMVVFAWAIPCLGTLWAQVLAVMAHDETGATNGSWLTRILSFNETQHTYHHKNPGDITRDGVSYWFIQLVRTDNRN